MNYGIFYRPRKHPDVPLVRSNIDTVNELYHYYNESEGTLMTVTPRWKLRQGPEGLEIGEVGKDHFCVVDRLSDAEEIVSRVNAIIDERNVLMEYVIAWRLHRHEPDFGTLRRVNQAEIAFQELIRSKP